MTEQAPETLSAGAIAAGIAAGDFTAAEIICETLGAAREGNRKINCFSALLEDRALARAARIDAAIAAGEAPGPLAGVPFAVKNLFDIRGLPTLAGSLINADDPPATADALLIRRLEDAGAILIGALGMGEYAYDFTGENIHYGACRNPHDTERMTGGSSSGSGAAVAAGLVPITLGSDTNGSIRVPASLCGVFGLKPTYGRLPRTGTFGFVDSLDHVGPLAASTADLALAYDLLQGWAPGDGACAVRAPELTGPALEKGTEDLRIARASGYWDCDDYPLAAEAVAAVCAALSVTDSHAPEYAAEGRAAAYLITNVEGAALHRDRLRTRIDDFDPDTRDRFTAGLLLPGHWYVRAQAARRRWHDSLLALFREIDLLVAPATPCAAPLLGTKTLTVGGEEQLLRPNLGLFAQPFSCAGFPVVTVPVWLDGESMPIGVQLVAPPWREDLALRAAIRLERLGVAECRRAVV